VNGATYQADQGIAPGSLAAAFGSFAQVPDQVIGGGVAATIVSASTSQVNFLVPSLPPGPRGIFVGAVAGQSTITLTGPGIFAAAVPAGRICSPWTGALAHRPLPHSHHRSLGLGDQHGFSTRRSRQRFACGLRIAMANDNPHVLALQRTNPAAVELAETVSFAVFD
jgi:hypothetical protein